jgi:D-alanyl-D-alanine carboxypeptidase/D-alanyl-D-alanine-endopeptidase (penicillin-binding protein 4)
MPLLSLIGRPTSDRFPAVTARIALAVSLAAALVLGLVAQPAAALSPQRTKRELAKWMRHAGAASGALVVDMGTGRTVYAQRPGVRRMPASVEKLYTTTAALLHLGSGHQLTTRALAVEPIGLDGTLDGNLYLHGGGDPTLTSAGLRVMARALVAETGLSRITGRVIGDDTAFDGLRGVPSAGFRLSVDVEPLGALMVDRGRTGRASPYYQADPAVWAASAFARQLRLAGVEVRRAGRRGTAPPGALALAIRRSPAMGTLVRLANVPSDNFVAEMLLKALGAADGDQGTTAGGAAVVEDVLDQALGIEPRIIDGSGLSRADRTSPRQVVDLLRQMADRPEGDTLYDSLAVMGRSGTLASRLRASVARDRCRGKTGTLRDVSNLAGYCTTTSGATVAFAILMNGVYPSAARSLQDRMVSAIARLEPPS